MTNFTIEFVYPWLLLLIIPMLALAFVPHLLTPKRYRRTRNRVTSLVLHCVVSALAVLVLCGMTFEYDKPNDENEILLLVDASYSTESSKATKEDFVKSVLDYNDSRYKIGVVVFGYDQYYASHMSYDDKTTFDNFVGAIESDKVDVTATDIESALAYARTLLKYPKTSKIVLVTDGAETDGRAMSVIRNISADGVKVDTLRVHELAGPELMPVSVELPEYNLITNDPFAATLVLRSSFAGPAKVAMYDNDVLVDTKAVDVVVGEQNVNFNHAIQTEGLHTLRFVVESGSDTITENNEYVSYVFIETYDKLLIIEEFEGESAVLKTALEESGFKVTVLDVNDETVMPKTINDLCAYDQVILVNVSPLVFPQNFENLLDAYVREVGGGLFTVGGSKPNGVDANAYNRDDMFETPIYQQLLPVQAINYTPPLGLVIVIDRSGSMTSGSGVSGLTRLDSAKEGAFACLELLSERDYCGVVSFDDDYSVNVEMTPKTQQALIIDAIEKIEPSGATMYSGAIDQAGKLLKGLRGVERKHIIFVTDGEPGGGDEERNAYLDAIADNFANGITISVIGIDISDSGNSAAQRMSEMAEQGGGRFYAVKSDELRDKMRDELKQPEISGYVPEEFIPKISNHTAAVAGITQKDFSGELTEDGSSYVAQPVTLGGYFGTRPRPEATTVLMSEYVPLYAQWQCGNGTVGSFMSDLKGTASSWSYGFMQSVIGKRFVTNVVKSLFPSRNIRSSDIKLELREQNYRTQLNVYTKLNDGETLKVETFINSLDSQVETPEQTLTYAATDNYSRVILTNKKAGVYRINVKKFNTGGEQISEAQLFKSFSFSAEYNNFLDSDKLETAIVDLAKLGKGEVLGDDPSAVFVDFVDKLHRIIDPRLAMIIIALILFLIDIAVRKFKFKWPHELIREYRMKKQVG